MKRVPKYRHFKARDIAFVEHKGKRKYFPGKYDSEESRAAYETYIADLTVNKALQDELTSGQVTLAGLSVAYLRYAEAYYGKGRHTPSAAAALAVRDFLHAGQGWELLLANDFTPKVLKAMQLYMTGRKLARSTINYRVAWIRRMVRWGVSEMLVDSDVYQALMSVTAIKKGRTEAYEPVPRQPVAWVDVEPVFSELTAQLRAARMVTVVHRLPQRVAGPGPEGRVPGGSGQRETAAMAPTHHKTERLGHELTIPIGPQCQKKIAKLLRPSRQKYLISPLAARNNGRATEHYSVQAYRLAVVRAQDRVIRDASKKHATDNTVYVPQHWTPHQLRHARGHMVRAKYGIESVQAVLGQASLDVAQLYRARRVDLAKQIALDMG